MNKGSSLNPVTFALTSRNTPAHPNLTPQYTIQKLNENKIVQLSLDSCVLNNIRGFMETGKLSRTYQKKFGLIPLVNLMKNGTVLVAAVGMKEITEENNYYDRTRTAWNKFAELVFSEPGRMVRDDPKAPKGKRPKPPKNTPFNEFSLEDKYLLSNYYHAMLALFLINQEKLSNTEKFKKYIKQLTDESYAVANINIEVARHLLWAKQKYQTPDISSDASQKSLQETGFTSFYETCSSAFYKHEAKAKKVKKMDAKIILANCLNATHDLALVNLTAAHSAMNEENQDGKIIESWLVTQDAALAQFAQDTYISPENGFMLREDQDYYKDDWSAYWSTTEGMLIAQYRQIQGRLDDLSPEEFDLRFYKTFDAIHKMEQKIKGTYKSKDQEPV
jgi:hypothetical protein